MTNISLRFASRFIAMCMVFALTPCKQSTTPPPPTGDCNTQFCELIANAGNPDWSPTGERFAFLRIADSMLCIYYLAGNHIETLIQGEEPSFSPDGKRIVYEWRRNIYIIDIDSKVSTHVAPGITPSWSENGAWIAFAHATSFKRRSTGELILGQPNPDSSIYLYDIAADTIGRIVINQLNPPTGAEVGVSYPTWILNDTYLAFATEPRVVAVPKDGGNWINLISLPAPKASPNRAKSEEMFYKSADQDLLGAGQIAWNPKLRVLKYYMGTTQFPTGIQRTLVQLIYISNSWGEFSSSGGSDPTWAPDSIRSLFVTGNSIWKIDNSKPSF